MIHLFKTSSIIIVSAIIVSSCGSDNKSFNEAIKPEDTATIAAPVNVSEQTLNDIIQSIPSPLEISSLIKASGAKYDNSILNTADRLDRYNTNYKKAFNLGVYSSDLGYLNIYERTFVSVAYIDAIRKLADDINVGQFFNFEVLKELATNRKDVDSLLYISTNSFNKMDEYLRTHKRGELSVLMISGAWLEGLHIACQVAKATPTKELYERMGEQKINLGNILLILNAFKTDKYFAGIVEQFEKLKQTYDNIEITYEYKEPETKEVNGQLVIVNQSTSNIKISEQQVKDIIKSTEEIRKVLIN